MIGYDCWNQIECDSWSWGIHFCCYTFQLSTAESDDLPRLVLVHASGCLSLRFVWGHLLLPWWCRSCHWAPVSLWFLRGGAGDQMDQEGKTIKIMNFYIYMWYKQLGAKIIRPSIDFTHPWIFPLNVQGLGLCPRAFTALPSPTILGYVTW